MKENIVIVPTYNEADNVAAIIEAVLGLPVRFDIMIVDDGSPDGTAQIVKDLQNKNQGRILLEERKSKSGLGTAYIHGFKKALAADYQLIYEMDADFSHNPQDLVQLYYACKNGSDLAIGSRYVRGVNVINWPMRRVLMSYFASKYVQFITGMPIHDATAGFKCYQAKVLRTINLDEVKFVGYAFQIEMKFLAWKYGFVLEEVPIVFTERTKGASKMSSKIFKEAVFGIIQMKILSFFRNFHKN